MQSTGKKHGADVGCVPPAGSVYTVVDVATRSQKIAFLVMQVLLLLTLLYLSTRVITIFLSPLVSPATLRVVLFVYCTSATFWQIAYMYRIVGMKRAVLREPQRMPQDIRLAMATTIVPSREIGLLRAKLEGMVRVRVHGNRLDCWVLDEENDARVRVMVEEFQRRFGSDTLSIRHFSRHGNPRLNEKAKGVTFRRFQERQKGGNINAWLDSTPLSQYDVVTFLDLDHIPLPHFYEKVLPYFRDAEIAFVQAPEHFENREHNFITRAASFERDTFFGLVHRSYFGLDMPVIVGSHTTFRSSALEALGGYYPVHLTEDFRIMLMMREARQKGVFVDDVVAIGELPSTWDAFIGQQFRWASGGLDLLIRHFFRLLRGYTWKERLFYFSLLNYYSWGTFYVGFKGFVYFLILVGLTLHLGTPLVLAIIVFAVVSATSNYLWERQFFVEQTRPRFFLQNAVMSNFLGSHYLIGLFKAVFVPNTSFRVTEKTGAEVTTRRRLSPFLIRSVLFVAAELAALFATSVVNGASGIMDGNALLMPLAVSAAGNVLVLACWRRFEAPSAAPVAWREVLRRWPFAESRATVALEES